MEQFKTEELFTIEEVAKWCNLSRDAAYMHYRRGHIKALQLPSHRIYFTRQAVDDFRANYVPFN